MISVIVPARNGKFYTANCLASLLYTFNRLGANQDVEYILIDDNSDPEQGICDQFLRFRKNTPAPVKIVRFKQRRYYAWGCAYGLACAKGSAVLFLSYDMCLTPDYLRTVTNVAALDETFGLIRGTSPYTDLFPQYRVVCPMPLRGFDDMANFAEFVARYHGLAHTEDFLLTGDAMLIKRSLLDKIGSFDTRFPFGYFSDVDFGIRCVRAGFKMVCAKGAWLHHEGAGAYKDEAVTKNIDINLVYTERMNNVQACFSAFRDKWDKSLPPVYINTIDMNFPYLRSATVDFDEHQPFVPLDDPLVELL
jgi:GT2 family glycosyltransferase